MIENEVSIILKDADENNWRDYQTMTIDDLKQIPLYDGPDFAKLICGGIILLPAENYHEDSAYRCMECIAVGWRKSPIRIAGHIDVVAIWKSERIQIDCLDKSRLIYIWGGPDSEMVISKIVGMSTVEVHMKYNVEV